jgi:hypothetical protein
MKGIVFVNFNEFINELWGDEFWDNLLNEAELPSGGVYTTFGTYDDQKLFTLICLGVDKKNIYVKYAQFVSVKWAFREFYSFAPAGVHNFTDVFESAHTVQSFIHLEADKLDTDTLPPKSMFLSETPKKILSHYQSAGKLCFLCEDILPSPATHTGQKVKVSQIGCEYESGRCCVLEVEKV